MRRIHFILIGIAAVLCGLAIYVLWAKPVIVLPPLTVSLSENNAIGAYQRRLGINELNVNLRTDGRLTISGDGQPLARLTYTPDSLKNASDLAQRMLMPPVATTTIRLLSPIYPSLTLNVYLDQLILYYVLPVEINIRFIRG